MYLEEASALADETRLIPVCNPDADTPDEAYPIHNIIPEQEWNALDSMLAPLKHASSAVECFKAMPYVRCDWLKGHLEQAVKKNKVPSATLYVYHPCSPSLRG